MKQFTSKLCWLLHQLYCEWSFWFAHFVVHYTITSSSVCIWTMMKPKMLAHFDSTAAAAATTKHCSERSHVMLFVQCIICLHETIHFRLFNPTLIKYNNGSCDLTWLGLAWLDLAWIELQCTVLCYIYASEWNGSNKWKMKCQYIQATMQMFSEHLFSYGYNTYLSMHATHQIAVISVFVHNVPHITHELHVAISWSDGIINATMFGFHNLLVLIDDHKASGKSYIWCLADESLQPGKITKFVENGSSFIFSNSISASATDSLN